MPRFVILYHRTPPGYSRPSHWDLMLEQDNSLATWALAAWPPAAQGDGPNEGVEIEAEKLADHRLSYLDYEGPISGGRGDVVRWDKGDYQSRVESEDEIQLTLSGERFQGTVVLQKLTQGAYWRVRFS